MSTEQEQLDALAIRATEIEASMVSINQVSALLKVLETDITNIVLDNCTTGVQAQIDELRVELTLLKATTQGDISALVYSSAKNVKIRDLTYTGSNLTKIEYYSDVAQTDNVFTMDLIYSGSVLTSTLLTRHVDSNLYTKTLSYSGFDLTKVVFS